MLLCTRQPSVALESPDYDKFVQRDLSIIMGDIIQGHMQREACSIICFMLKSWSTREGIKACVILEITCIQSVGMAISGILCLLPDPAEHKSFAEYLPEWKAINAFWSWQSYTRMVDKEVVALIAHSPSKISLPYHNNDCLHSSKTALSSE